MGKATMASYLTTEEAKFMMVDLAQARKAFVMSTDLHLTFLITPLNDDVMQRIEWKT